MPYRSHSPVRPPNMPPDRFVPGDRVIVSSGRSSRHGEIHIITRGQAAFRAPWTNGMYEWGYSLRGQSGYHPADVVLSPAPLPTPEPNPAMEILPMPTPNSSPYINPYLVGPDPAEYRVNASLYTQIDPTTFVTGTAIRNQERAVTETIELMRRNLDNAVVRPITQRIMSLQQEQARISSEYNSTGNSSRRAALSSQYSDMTREIDRLRRLELTESAPFDPNRINNRPGTRFGALEQRCRQIAIEVKSKGTS
jgi:hypothetical protein